MISLLTAVKTLALMKENDVNIRKNNVHKTLHNFDSVKHISKSLTTFIIHPPHFISVMKHSPVNPLRQIPHK